MNKDMKLRKFIATTIREFLNEQTKIDGLEYPIPEDKFKWIANGENSRYAYVNNNPDNYMDRKNIRVYNPVTKKHYYLENVEVKVGDNNLLFVDFPRTDAPVDSWSQHATQYAIIRNWNRDNYQGDFVRYEILEINKNGMCKVSDGYNEPSGWYARDSFYKINKIIG